MWDTNDSLLNPHWPLSVIFRKAIALYKKYLKKKCISVFTFRGINEIKSTKKYKGFVIKYWWSLKDIFRYGQITRYKKLRNIVLQYKHCISVQILYFNGTNKKKIKNTIACMRLHRIPLAVRRYL